MGDIPEKHKCLNCDGNHTSTAKSCSEKKRITNRRNRINIKLINRIEMEAIELETTEMETIENFKTEIIKSEVVATIGTIEAGAIATKETKE